MTDGRQMAGFWLALITAILWGALPLGLAFLLDVLDVLTITWARFLFAAVAVFLWLWRSGGLPQRAQFDLQFSMWLLITVVALIGNFILYLVGLELLNPETTQVLIQLAPFLLMFGSIWFYGERLGPIEWLGSAILLFGFGLFFNEKLRLLLGEMSGYTWGVVAMLGAASSWTIYGLMQKLLLRRMGSMQLTLLIYAGGALALWAFSAPSDVGNLNWIQVLALVFCGLNLVLGYGAFTEAMRVWQAAKVGAVIALAPVFTILFMAIAVRVAPTYFVSSELNLWSYVGAAMVVAGSMLATLAKAR